MPREKLCEPNTSTRSIRSFLVFKRRTREIYLTKEPLSSNPAVEKFMTSMASIFRSTRRHVVRSHWNCGIWQSMPMVSHGSSAFERFTQHSNGEVGSCGWPPRAKAKEVVLRSTAKSRPKRQTSAKRRLSHLLKWADRSPTSIINRHHPSSLIIEPLYNHHLHTI